MNFDLASELAALVGIFQDKLVSPYVQINIPGAAYKISTVRLIV
jgi:hypothetical protein